ncbi:MAG: endonuclease [Frankiales bacterium]|nr:endonuclease [Frankiales bacterium]
MPEGHTIHRLARDHRPLLVGQAVSLASPQGKFADGAALLSGRTCTRIEPYGKHLWYLFDGESDGDLSLHVHLGLYGKWAVGAGAPPEVRGQLRLRMTAGDAWLDLRGPTVCEVHTRADRKAVLARLGPDPLRRTDDGLLAWERLSRSRTAVGQLLMDQSVLAGVGNVYRAELLFRTRLSPFTPGRDVPRETWDLMWADLRALMRAGVKTGRIVTTGARGVVRREDAHYVYRRAGQPCRLCGTEIRTEVMAGRNLFWCPTDQA